MELQVFSFTSDEKVSSCWVLRDISAYRQKWRVGKEGELIKRREDSRTKS